MMSAPLGEVGRTRMWLVNFGQEDRPAQGEQTGPRSSPDLQT